MEVINTIRGIRDLRQYSAFKDYAAEHPDWAESPEGVERAIAINPELAYQGANLGAQLYEQRMKRAGSRLIYQNTADQAGHRAYTDFLAKNPNDYAGAEKAGNAIWQRYLQAAEVQYGPEFAANLKKTAPVWNLNGYSTRQPVYDQLLSAMRVPTQIQMHGPDGKPLAPVTKYLLPGAETEQFLKDNAAAKPLLLKQGETAPPAFVTVGGPEGPVMNTSTGELRTNPLFQMQQDMRNDFSKNQIVQRYHVAEPAFVRGMDALAMGREAVAQGQNPQVFDTQAFIMFAQLDNPQVSATEGNIDTLARQGALSPDTMRWYNLLRGQGGTLTDTQRVQMAKAMDSSYRTLRGQYQPLRDFAASQEKRQQWKPGTITGYAPMKSEAELKDLRDKALGAGGGAVPQDAGESDFNSMTGAELRTWATQHTDPKTGKVQFADDKRRAAWNRAMQFQMSRGQGGAGAQPAAGQGGQ